MIRSPASTKSNERFCISPHAIVPEPPQAIVPEPPESKAAWAADLGQNNQNGEEAPNEPKEHLLELNTPLVMAMDKPAERIRSPTQKHTPKRAQVIRLQTKVNKGFDASPAYNPQLSSRNKNDATAWSCTQAAAILGHSFGTLAFELINTGFDIAVTNEYFQTKQWFFFSVMLTSLLLEKAVQVSLVCLQYKSSPRRAVAQTILTLLSIRGGMDVLHAEIRPGFNQRKEYESFAPQIMRSYSRTLSVVFESLPASAIQFTSILGTVGGGGAFPLLEVLSCVFGLMNVGMYSSNLTKTFDIDDVNLENEPTFYGLFPPPEEGIMSKCARFSLRGLLWFRSVCQQISFNCAVHFLRTLGGDWGNLIVAHVIILGLATALGVKAYNKNLLHWIQLPANPNWTSRLALAILARTTTLMVLAFSGSLQFRHPREIGGPMWLATMAGVHVVGLAAGVAMWSIQEGSTINGMVLVAFLIASVLTWVSLAFIVRVVCPASLRWSFYTAPTGPAYSKAAYWEDHGLRVHLISTFDYFMWRGYEKEVELWIEENWQAWVRNRRPWATREFLDKIPVHLLSVETREVTPVRLSFHPRSSLIALLNKVTTGLNSVLRRSSKKENKTDGKPTSQGPNT